MTETEKIVNKVNEYIINNRLGEPIPIPQFLGIYRKLGLDMAQYPTKGFAKWIETQFSENFIIKNNCIYSVEVELGKIWKIIDEEIKRELRLHQKEEVSVTKIGQLLNQSEEPDHTKQSVTWEDLGSESKLSDFIKVHIPGYKISENHMYLQRGGWTKEEYQYVIKNGIHKDLSVDFLNKQDIECQELVMQAVIMEHRGYLTEAINWYGKAYEKCLNNNLYKAFSTLKALKNLNIQKDSNKNTGNKYFPQRGSAANADYTILIDKHTSVLAELCARINDFGRYTDEAVGLIPKDRSEWNDWWRAVFTAMDEVRKIRNVYAHTDDPIHLEENVKKIYKWLIGDQHNILSCTLIGKVMCENIKLLDEW